MSARPEALSLVPATGSLGGTGDPSTVLEPLLTAERVATILGVRPKRVYELGIPAVQLSARAKRWRRSAIEAWLASREVTT